MSSGNKVFPLVEENSPKSSDKKKKENHISNKNNIDINKVVSDFKLKKRGQKKMKNLQIQQNIVDKYYNIMIITKQNQQD
jgi:hypothetical protein